MLKILAEQQTALLVGGHGQNQCVPYRHVMIRSQIKCRAHGRDGGIRRLVRVGPTQDCCFCIDRCATGLAGENAVQFAQRLRGNHYP